MNESEPVLTRQMRRAQRKRERLEEKLRRLEERARENAPSADGHSEEDGPAKAPESRDPQPDTSRAALTPEQRDRRYLIGQATLVFVIVIFPWLPIVSYSVLGRANLAGQYALIAVSLVVLTGWVGQVSLGQAAFVGMGAYMTGIANEAWGLAFPINMVVGIAAGSATAAILGTVALRVRGLYLAVATLIFSWTADAFLFQQEILTEHSSVVVDPIGQEGTYPFLDFTSRRSFYYVIWAVVALVILATANLRDRKVGRAFFAIRGSEMAAASLGIDVVRTKLTAFALSGGIAGLAGTMTIIGAQVVTPEQFNLARSLFFLSIAVVGGLTSLPGAVAAGMVFAAMEEVFFRFPAIGDYLQLFSAGLLAAVLLLYPGGLAALGRALWNRADPYLARATFTAQARLDQLLARLRRTPDPAVIADSPGPELVVGGASRREPWRVPPWLGPLWKFVEPPLARLRATREARRQVRQSAVFVDFSAALKVDPVEEEENGTGLASLGRHKSAVSEQSGSQSNGVAGGGHDDEGTGADADDPAPEYVSWEDIEIEDPGLSADDREHRRPLISADRVIVRFGGLTAVNEVTLAVREGEIVGLIGPNGAGKTTTFNSIAGFNTPTEGSVYIHGLDVTEFPVYLRSRLGVARTFQAIQLFPQLNVFDNLMVATYVADSSGFFSNMFASTRALLEEQAARQKVVEVIRLLDLQDVAYRQVSDLPFGVLRMVEIARAMVTGAPVIMLDEPASGLDDLETQRLSKLVRFIRSLGVTILLIEHDVQMVTSLSDYMYVIDQGTPIAEGTPDEIKRNPAVISAYLGEETEESGDAAESVEVNA